MPLKLPIYLDNNATTRCDPRVVEAMLPLFCDDYGNAASKTHALGWKANDAVTGAREQVASLIRANAREIVFTSGATESDNLAIKGAVAMLRSRGDHVVTVATEHKAVLDVCGRLERDGIEVTYLPVDGDGLVTAEQVEEALTGRTVLVSVMAANNEVGVLQPLAGIGRMCKRRGVLFHTDAAQALGKVPLDVEALGADLMSLSAHKLHGPKGVGALYVRRRDPHVRIEPQMDGGGHERGMRSGTLNVPGVVGFGKACDLAFAEMAIESARLTRQRDHLRTEVCRRLPAVTVNGHPTQRLPGNLNLSFAGIRAEALLMALRELCLSPGSACTSASVEPSHVLRALGLADDLAGASLRFGLGRFTTDEEIDFAIGRIVAAVEQLRAISPDWELGKMEPQTNADERR